MTKKAQNIIKRIRERDERRRVFARLKDPKHRNHLVADINLLDQDEPAQVGKGDQEIRVLNEMNELEQEHDRYMENLRAER